MRVMREELDRGIAIIMGPTACVPVRTIVLVNTRMRNSMAIIISPLTVAHLNLTLLKYYDRCQIS